MSELLQKEENQEVEMTDEEKVPELSPDNPNEQNYEIDK